MALASFKISVVCFGNKKGPVVMETMPFVKHVCQSRRLIVCLKNMKLIYKLYENPLKKKIMLFLFEIMVCSVLF